MKVMKLVALAAHRQEYPRREELRQVATIMRSFRELAVAWEAAGPGAVRGYPEQLRVTAVGSGGALAMPLDNGLRWGASRDGTNLDETLVPVYKFMQAWSSLGNNCDDELDEGLIQRIEAPVSLNDMVESIAQTHHLGTKSLYTKRHLFRTDWLWL